MTTFTRQLTSLAAFLSVALFSTMLLAQQTQVVPPSDNIARQIGCTLSWNGQGFLVGYVYPGSPAYQAGLETGDIIVGAGQTPMRNTSSFQTALVNNPGSQIQLTVINVRNGQYVNVWLRIRGGGGVSPPTVIVPPPGVTPQPQPTERYLVQLRHPVTNGVVFYTTRNSRVSAESAKSAYSKYHWRIWQKNGIEEDINYKRFNSAAQAHNYQLESWILGFYINKVRPGQVSIRQIQ